MRKEKNTTEEKQVVKISVRRLVEFLLRSGDLDTREVSGRRDQEAMLAGSRIHRTLQKRQKESYTAEVPLRCKREYDELILNIEGRADGIIDEVRADGTREVVIDEIKGMYLDVTELEEPFPLHLAQAKCYAYIYAKEQDLEIIRIQMTYANLETEETRRLTSKWSFDELETWFCALSDDYYQWAKWSVSHRKQRDESMQGLEFPFPYREGQQKLTRAVYHTIREGQQLFLMAPTGVGKTMSCLYPAVRAVGQGLGDLIFYLTAKNETLRAGEDAFRILLEKGLDYKVVRITSKEKTCPKSEVRCNPEDCAYAKGHFDRINEAVFTLLKQKEAALYDLPLLLDHAAKWNVCPFELTLDLASWCDAVLCDYNYVFDPKAKLARFFGEGAKGEYLFLVDEAHNLVDRGREMYSASLTKEHVLGGKRVVGDADKKLTRALERVNRQMLSLKHELNDQGECGTSFHCRKLEGTDLDPLEYACLQAMEAMQRFFENSGDGELKEKLLEVYFELIEFVDVLGKADECYVNYMAEVPRVGEEKKEQAKTNFVVKLFCVNPASRLTECINRGRASVFFSATLLPIQYFKTLLTVKEDPYAIYAQSPFPKEHRRLLIAGDVSTRYKRRGREMYRRIASYIKAAAKSKVGNYFVFFPSYQMMYEVFRIYRKEFDEDGINWILQSQYMSDPDREIFLENFYEDPEESLVAFAVMGGIFSEGLDLTGTRLIGVIVVGTGLPQVSPEQNLLKEYYDGTGDGFRYAYIYPGMNKVEQAAGRVIRTAFDRGIVLLLDERFLELQYRALFPREWSDWTRCTIDTAQTLLEEFWSES